MDTLVNDEFADEPLDIYEGYRVAYKKNMTSIASVLRRAGALFGRK